jgi:hypothetical protein
MISRVAAALVGRANFSFAASCPEIKPRMGRDRRGDRGTPS